MKEVEEVLFVDQNKADLITGVGRCRLLAADFLTKREKPVEFKFIIGCVTHKDPILLGTDALVSIEV